MIKMIKISMPVLDEAEKVIFQISNKRSTQSFVQLNIWLKKTFKHLSELKSHSKGITGIASGYKKLDQMTSGFQKGDFIVLAARPSMGKTALALTIAAQAAADRALGWFFFFRNVCRAAYASFVIS